MVHGSNIFGRRVVTRLPAIQLPAIMPSVTARKVTGRKIAVDVGSAVVASTMATILGVVAGGSFCQFNEVQFLQRERNCW